MSWFSAKDSKADFNDYSPLPAGIYKMFVEECELATDKNNQEYIKLVLEVLDGEKKGRKLFENLRLDSEYEGVKKQSEAVLKKLCEAKGIETLGGPRDLAKFIGLELDVKIGLFTTKKGEQKNAINGMRKSATEQVQKPATPPPGNDVPW